MKVFKAKKIKIIDGSGNEILDQSGKEIKFSFANFAMDALNAPVSGLSTNQMRLRFKLMDRLEILNPDESIELDETEFALLQNAVIAIDDKEAWVAMSRDLPDFVDYIRSL